MRDIPCFRERYLILLLPDGDINITCLVLVSRMHLICVQRLDTEGSEYVQLEMYLKEMWYLV